MKMETRRLRSQSLKLDWLSDEVYGMAIPLILTTCSHFHM